MNIYFLKIKKHNIKLNSNIYIYICNVIKKYKYINNEGKDFILFYFTFR
jgi:hypothetical protein